jgi:rubredoxin
MASMKGKRIFIIFVISPLVFIFSFFLGMTIHVVMIFIGLIAASIIVVMATIIRCPRCGVKVDLFDLKYRRNLFTDSLLCENCGYNFSEDVSKTRTETMRLQHRKKL